MSALEEQERSCLGAGLVPAIGIALVGSGDRLKKFYLVNGAALRPLMSHPMLCSALHLYQSNGSLKYHFLSPDRCIVMLLCDTWPWQFTLLLEYC